MNNSDLITQVKLRAALPMTAIALVGWGAFVWQLKHTQSVSAPTEKTVYLDKLIYQDRVVTKDIVRTETRPDGTKIITESRAHSETTKSEAVKQVSTLSVARPTYSFGLGIERAPTLSLTAPLSYQTEVGYRITGDLWTATTLTFSDKWKLQTVSAALRFEF